MLKPAQLYKEELQQNYIETWYDLSYQYYHSSTGRGQLHIPNDSFDNCSFACVDKNDNVIGFFSYRIDWQAHCIYSIGIISFVPQNIILIKDVINHIKNLFINHNLNRVEWYAYTDNPAIRGYENIIKRFGGRKVGELHQANMLSDGKLHDTAIYEILREDVRL